MTEALRPELFDLRVLAARPSTPGVELERRGRAPPQLSQHVVRAGPQGTSCACDRTRAG
jgi:hypothetical protein